METTRGKEQGENLFPGLAEHLGGLTATLEQIEEPYRSAGRRLAEWIAATRQPGEPLRVVVVCTGNSRRSMLGAMMGNAATTFHGLPEIQFFTPGRHPAPSIRGRSQLFRRSALRLSRSATKLHEEFPAAKPALPCPLGDRGRPGNR